jgi:hypothetical protein
MTPSIILGHCFKARAFFYQQRQHASNLLLSL